MTLAYGERARIEPPPTRDVEPGDRIGAHELLEVIGQGAMGVVYRARDPRLRREVALKLVSPSYAAAEARARLLEEARALARLSHPNVVAIFDAGVHDDRVFLVMELVEGSDLACWLRTREPSWRETIDVFLGASAGLRAAHAAGVIHRDFKPSNVLLGRDGRARVVDFGLARAIAAPEPTLDEVMRSAERTGETKGLTRDGMVMGTPAYMAPEQHYGEPVTPASDQFAFCVSLYQALYGELPFAGRTFEIVAAKRSALRRPDDERGVPRQLFEILARGLQHAPERRFANMFALERELARARRGRRRWVVASGVGALVAVTVPFVLADPERCGGGQRTVEAWDEATADELARAFEATAAAGATDAWVRTETALDEWFRRWRSAYDASCRAPQNEDLDHVMACLDASLRDAAALVDVLREPDAGAVRSAVESVRRLPPPDACADPALRSSSEPIPPDPSLRAPVQEIRDALRRAAALERTGRYREGLAIARDAVAAAERTDFAAVQAEAWQQLAALEDAEGSRATVVADFEHAYFEATRIGHDTVAAKSALGLAWYYSERDLDLAAARRWAELASAIVERLGGDVQLWARLHNTLGGIAMEESQRSEALGHYGRMIELLDERDPMWFAAMVNRGIVHWRHNEPTSALEAYEAAQRWADRELGPDHPKSAAVHDLAGLALVSAGRLGDAVAEHEIAVSTLERALGPEHPDLARRLTNLARVVERVGDPERAIELYRRALAIEERKGDELSSSATLVFLGNLLAATGYYDAARVHLRRALELQEAFYGPTHPELGYVLIGLGTVAEKVGLPDEALVHYERALTAARERPGVAARVGPLAMGNIADVLEDRGDHLGALEHRRRAVADLATITGEGSVEVALARASLARTLISLERFDEARPLAESSVATLAGDRGWPEVRGWARVVLADALWPVEAERPRARELVVEALGEFVAAGDVGVGRAEDARAWLAARDPNGS